MRKKRRTSHLIQFLLLLVTLSACAIPKGGSPQPLATEVVVTPFTVTPSVVPPTVVTADWFQVYFTNPAAPMAEDYAGGPDEVLADAIHAARLSLDVAVYSLNLWSIRNASWTPIAAA